MKGQVVEKINRSFSLLFFSFLVSRVIMYIVDRGTIKLSIGSSNRQPIVSLNLCRAGAGGASTFALAREHEYTNTNHEAKGLHYCLRR